MTETPRYMKGRQPLVLWTVEWRGYYSGEHGVSQIWARSHTMAVAQFEANHTHKTVLSVHLK